MEGERKQKGEAETIEVCAVFNVENTGEIYCRQREVMSVRETFKKLLAETPK